MDDNFGEWVGVVVRRYRRTGFKCVVKCLRLRENKLIAIADDLQFEPHPRASGARGTG